MCAREGRRPRRRVEVRWCGNGMAMEVGMLYVADAVEPSIDGASHSAGTIDCGPVDCSDVCPLLFFSAASSSGCS